MNERKISWEAFSLDSDFSKTERDRFIENLDETDEEESEIADELRGLQTIISTPIGDFIKEDKGNPLRRYEHWILYANFDITEKEFVITNYIPGVISVSAISRYELMIGFAKTFSASDVKREIEKTLINIEDYDVDLLEIQKDVLLMDSQ
jgi:hypothetical protein